MPSSDFKHLGEISAGIRRVSTAPSQIRGGIAPIISVRRPFAALAPVVAKIRCRPNRTVLHPAINFQIILRHPARAAVGAPDAASERFLAAAKRYLGEARLSRHRLRKAAAVTAPTEQRASELPDQPLFGPKRTTYQSNLAATWMTRVPPPLVIVPTVLLVMFVAGPPGLK